LRRRPLRLRPLHVLSIRVVVTRGEDLWRAPFERVCFLRAEDGIRDGHVTGVQTCALPISASLPAILTGLRAGLSLAWMFVVAAELIAASNGLGFLLVDGQATMRPDRVLASIVAFALLGRISDAALGAIERRALRWRDSL